MSVSGLQYTWDAGVNKCLETLVNILTCIKGEASLAELEDLCKKALIENGQKSFVATNDAVKIMLSSKSKEPDKNVFDKLKEKAKDLKDKTANSLNDNIISALTPVQIKNNAMRFGKEDTSATHKSLWPFAGKSVFSEFVGKEKDASRDYEDVVSPEVIAAPICDVCIIEGGDPVPDGFYRIYKTPTNKKANLNSSNNGDDLFLCIKKDLTGRMIPITSLVTFIPTSNEFLPVGYDSIRKNGMPCDVNQSSDPDIKTRVFIGYKKEKNGNPIKDLQIIFPEKNEETPPGFNCITRTPTGIVADLNTGTSGWVTFLSYKQTAVKLLPLIREAAADRGLLQLLSSEGEYNNSSMSINKRLSLPKTQVAINKAEAGGSIAKSSLTPGGGSKKPLDSVVVEENNEDVDDSVSVLSEMSVLSSSSDDINDHFNYSETIILNSDGSEVPFKIKRLIYVLLSALYIRHDKIPNIAIAGLSKLLKETNFFESDLQNLAPPSFRRVTLLDLTVSVVCDRFDMCQEKEFEDLLQFMRTLVQYSNGVLSIGNLQKIYRVISYLFTYFSTNPQWNIKCYSHPLSVNTKEELPVLKVLKELIWTVQAQIEKVEIAHFLSLPDLYCEILFSPLPRYKEESVSIVQSLVKSFIDDLVEHIELSTTAESILVLMNKSTESVFKTSFWLDISHMGKHLFTDTSYRILFITLSAILKSAWQPIRKNNKNTGFKDSDFGIKLLALEALIYFCDGAGEKLRHSKIMGYVVRRIIVSCILYNVQYMFMDHRIFQKLMKLMSSLWENWRMHIRIEFAVLCETLVIRMLQASTACIRPIYQLVVLQEVVNWFHQPFLLAEMFINYDIDSRFNWNIFSHLIREVCTLARKTSITAKIMDFKVEYKSPGNTESNKYTNKDKALSAISNITKIAKTLMDAAGHAHMLMLNKDRGAADGRNSPSCIDLDSPGEGRKSPDKFIQSSNNQKIQNEELISQAIKIYREKESIKKAVSYLVTNGYMPDTPAEIVHFLRLNMSSFDPTALGDFLGEGGNPTKAEEIEYYNQIRFRYIRAVSFVEKDVADALRLFLTDCGFRLPGEAQKIDRLMEAFSKIWYQDNIGTKHCPFYGPDAVFVLSFAIVMLNTDLHKASNDQPGGKKAFKKMTVEQFISNLRDINNGQSINPSYLTKIYENIAANQIYMNFGANEKQPQQMPSHQPKKSSLLTVLSNIPKLLQPKIQEEKKNEVDFKDEIIASSSETAALLRAFSPFSYRYLISGIDTNISLDLITLCYESVCIHFFDIPGSLIENIKKMDLNIVFCAMDILGYGLCTCVLLQMPEKKKQFADLLLQYRDTYEPIATHSGRKALDDSWYEAAVNSNTESAMECVSQIYKLIVHLKDSIQKSIKEELTITTVAKIEKKAKILESNLYFIKDGDLMMRDKDGKLVSYRFFLFSDELFYCGLEKGEYKVHSRLQLVSLTVSDIDSDTTECNFYVNHPSKSFVVVAPDPEVKKSWIKDLHEAAMTCIKRQMAATRGPIERRMSLVGRIGEQKSVESKQRESVRLNLGKSLTPERTKDVRPRAELSALSDVSSLLLKEESNSSSSGGQSVSTNNTDMPNTQAFKAEGSVLEITPPASPKGSTNTSSSLLEVPTTFATNSTTTTPPTSPTSSASVTSPSTMNSSNSGNVPIANSRELLKQQAIDKIQSVLATISTRQLDSVFNAGAQFWKGLKPMEPAKSMLLKAYNECKKISDEMIASKIGDEDEDDDDENCDDDEEEVAVAANSPLAILQKEFLVHLITYYSYWKYDQYI